MSLFVIPPWVKALAGLVVIGVAAYGGSRLQALIDSQMAADIARLQAVRDITAADALLAANDRVREAERKALGLNWRIENDILPKLDAARARGDNLAKLLHNALAATASVRAVPAPADQPAADAPTGELGDRGGAIEAATAAHFTACHKDAVRLDGLQAEIKGQT